MVKLIPLEEQRNDYDAEEAIVHHYRVNKDGSITAEIRVNVYIDDVCYTTVRQMRLEKT